ncbi:MAG: phytanoyl-CoA dioxygenase family protein [Planctomycetota bacterium]|nr:phytanoyl-CoA dioxygenase family protein [Planctomycetota bacterium]MDA1136942.1 phytanoyl-CoA dioxygenase family protein [Planctomycetota bacterium]
MLPVGGRRSTGLQAGVSFFALSAFEYVGLKGSAVLACKLALVATIRFGNMLHSFATLMNTRYPELGLDLSYHPVRCDSPNAFTLEQIAQFNAEGYLTNLDLFSEDEAAALSRRFDQCGGEGAKLNPHTRIDWVWEIAENERVLACLQDLLGENIVCFISQFIDKKPGSKTSVEGHQDSSYFAVDAGSVNLWIALGEADEENGCLWFVPGSHLLGGLPVRNPAGDLNVVESELEAAVNRLGKIPIPLKAGRMVIFSDLLLHISPPNKSANRNRPALTLTYASAQKRPHDHPKARHEPVLCCGGDVSGHWKLLPPPTAVL